MTLPGCFCNQELCSPLQTSFLDTCKACGSCARHSDSRSSSQLVQTPAGGNFWCTLPVLFCLGDRNLPSWWWTQSLASLLTHFLSNHLLTEWSGLYAGCSMPEETNGIQGQPSAPQRYKKRWFRVLRESDLFNHCRADRMTLNGIQAAVDASIFNPFS